MAKNTGTKYENFVKIIQETILNLSNSDLSPTKHITIERNKIIHDKNEIAREFDLYWEFEYGGYQYCSVIECKDYASKVSIEKIDAFLGKTIDIPGLRLIYATKTGYQSGALTKAEKHNIDLLVVRGANDKDFITKDGIPLIRQIICTMITKPIQIKSINFDPDISWFTLQSPFIQQTIKQKFKNGAIDNNSYIVNKTKNTQLSLEEFAIYAKEKIVNKHYEDKQGVYGEILDNSYLKFIDSDLEVKLKGYNLTYCWDKTTKHNINIDLMQQILGIIHNYTTNKKQIVFKDGNIKNLD